MNTSFRNLPLAGLNVTNVIISYYIEVLNIMASTFDLSLIYILCISPLPLLPAQIIYIFCQTCFSLITALGSAVSCFQMFYVIKFDLLFSLDPQLVGRWTLIVLAVAISIPNAIMGTLYTLNGQHADKAMAFLTHEEMSPGSFSFVSRQSIFWTLFFMSSSCVAFVFIPIFFKKRQQNSSGDRPPFPPQRTITLKRYLLGSTGFLIIFILSVLSVRLSDTNRHLPIAMYVTTISTNLLLAYHLMDQEARKAAKRYLLGLFGIEERTPVVELADTSWSYEEQMSGSTEAETSFYTLSKNTFSKTMCSRSATVSTVTETTKRSI
jgi:hypothetical protein